MDIITRRRGEIFIAQELVEISKFDDVLAAKKSFFFLISHS